MHEGIENANVGRPLSWVVLNVEQLEAGHVGRAEVHFDVLFVEQVGPSATGPVEGFGLVGHPGISESLLEHLHVTGRSDSSVFLISLKSG